MTRSKFIKPHQLVLKALVSKKVFFLMSDMFLLDNMLFDGDLRALEERDSNFVVIKKTH